MSEAISKYNPIRPNQTGSVPHKDELRLLSDKAKQFLKGYDELALLSKRRARAILRIGNDTLNTLIKDGDIKVIVINNKVKIPYVSIQEYVYKMSVSNKSDVERYQYIDEDEAVAAANKIITEINKGA